MSINHHKSRAPLREPFATVLSHSHSSQWFVIEFYTTPGPFSTIRHPDSRPALLQLPAELLDLVASFVATHRDLVALALTCRALACIIIPTHAAYRDIRIDSRRGPTPWENITARPNFAAGVRCVTLFDRSEARRFLPERFPNVIIPAAVSDAAVTSSRELRRMPRKKRGGLNAETLAAAANALRVMPNLHSLVFSGSLLHDMPACHSAEALFWEAAVSRRDSLRHIEYIQPLNPPAPLPRYTTEVQLYPFWSISNLTSLSVKHAAFLRHPPSVVQFSRVLHNSPSLENLTIEVYDWAFDLRSLFHEVRFPHLRTLALEIYARPEPTNARALAEFLERTPTLQHVAWYHLDPGPLSSGALPALRSLRADVPDSPGIAGRALLPDSALVSLGPICVTPRTMEAMEHMRRREMLRRLDVVSFESIPSLVRVVSLFPHLRWLRVPTVDYWHEHRTVTPVPIHPGEWVKVLDALPMLEIFRGVSIFRDPDNSNVEENDVRARDILNICPRMRQVEHWDLDPTHVISLESEGDRVVWRVVEVVDETDESSVRDTWTRETI
ncbi:hypothetical protein B0F90DRAFT_1925019 [Multifurca ochricompacta]|uniref:F-box domain-containing protein n=1 Tax=Multifurca ochricompacta TaxID=376703 RepID=A0AAD4QPD3_9AGAM|nr:hypothetical protein B0F90DRAFT_1925019 [Multifurca ochricompacta]